eukprot:CAMPEP_0184273112 /NCGR_PEP_ID=MMETSP0977-20130417/42873_1 /TAXON_ID=483370 /ORGANISM="non described non described, Strain CCMP2097" /LENGTH=30 /DNA_ID= /DNA_START= /DNA_END= /DNA_ORIENTATION=
MRATASGEPTTPGAMDGSPGGSQDGSLDAR